MPLPEIVLPLAGFFHLARLYLPWFQHHAPAQVLGSKEKVVTIFAKNLISMFECNNVLLRTYAAVLFVNVVSIVEREFKCDVGTCKSWRQEFKAIIYSHSYRQGLNKCIKYQYSSYFVFSFALFCFQERH